MNVLKLGFQAVTIYLFFLWQYIFIATMQLWICLLKTDLLDSSS